MLSRKQKYAYVYTKVEKDPQNRKVSAPSIPIKKPDPDGSWPPTGG